MIRDTIKKHSDFAAAENDPSARCSFFLVRAKPAKFPDDARYGLIVTKKSFRFAVTRNRAKRLLRDWIAYNEHMMCPDMDYIFIARRDIVNANRTDGRVAMRKALNYIRKTVRGQNSADNAQ